MSETSQQADRRVASTVRVLIVEDDPELAESLAMVLGDRYRRWDIHLTDSLSGALRILGAQAFDAAIVDLGLPDTSGSEAPRRIRERFPELPIVVHTGQSSDVLARALIKAGIQDYVVKGQASPEHIASTVLNARERASYVRDLERAAERDPLTGALNRRCFDAAVAREITRSRELDKGFGLVYLDLDDFKSINDAYGHGGGDRALRAFADWLASESRPSDRIFRLGGDEFAVLLTDVSDRESLRSYRDRLERQTACAFRLADEDLPMRVSFGSAVFPEDGTTPEALARSADRRMYAMKRGRRKERRTEDDDVSAATTEVVDEPR